MRISDVQVKKVLEQAATPLEQDYEIEKRIRQEDGALIDELAAKVAAMPDREEIIAELKAKIEAGEYNPTGEEISEAMIRRAIADRIR